MKFEELFSLENLNEAFYLCIKDNHWKESTHKYWVNLLQNNMELREDLLSGNYRVSPKTVFYINERGKHRKIEAPAMRDRVVQKVLCTRLLIPKLRPYLIYDNYASLEDRGTRLARKRMKICLENWKGLNGDDGYITLIDIHNYFGSVPHARLKEKLHEKIHEDEMTINLIDYTVDTSGPNGVGLNLGSEAPQIYSVFYLTSVDNYFTIVKGNNTYGRYMDDIKYFNLSKQDAKENLLKAEELINNEGLELNKRKTQIVKISHGFTYLQTKYNIDENRIVTRPTHDKIVREKRKIVTARHLVDEGRVTDYEVLNWYRSWRGGLLKDYNSCYGSLKSVDKLFNELFPVIKKPTKGSRNKMIRQIFKEAEYEDLQYFWRGIDDDSRLFEGTLITGQDRPGEIHLFSMG